MDLIKYFTILFVFITTGDAGGHGEKHHDHVRLHVPEFIHHDRHTKVITIHHHHHKPKQETHHHHHHLPKPHLPVHHYQHKKTSTHSVSKGHSSHKGSHGSHGSHGHHGHHGNHGHHSHGHHGHHHKHHDTPSYDPPPVSYDTPSINYASPAISHESPQTSYPSPTHGHDYSSFVPSVPSSPHVHGVVHTVNQVKVFDSLPGALPGGNTASHGYEVTEQGDDEHENDIYTAVNTLSQTYPGTYGFIRSAAPVQSDPFSELTQQSSASSPSHDTFAAAQPNQEHFAPQANYANLEDFSDSDNHAISFQNQGGYSNIQPSQFTGSDTSATGFDDSGNNIGGDIGGTAYLSSAEGFHDDTPVTFNREAGIQHSVNSGVVQTLEY